MDRIDDTTVVSPTDLVAYLACGQVTWLDRLAAAGTIGKPQRDDPMLVLLQARGMDHEHVYLDSVKGEGASVVEIPEDPSDADDAIRPSRAQALVARDQATRRAMADGADVVYQATFLDQTAPPWWRGHADFLRRVDTPSSLGGWSYEPVDTKLARHVRASAVLQLCFYAEQVERMQGTAADRVHVVLGTNEKVSVRLVEVDAYYRAVRQQFLDVLSLGVEAEPYPLPCDHCAICRWAGRCHQRWDDDDHLSRVAFITREQTRRLEVAGITALRQLAAAPDATTVADVSTSVLERLRAQARLQAQSRPGEPPPVEAILPVEAEMGLAGLPAPDPGDLFYDIEGHPYVGDHGLEYLHGLGWERDGQFEFEPMWAHTPAAERLVFERLIDRIVERRRLHPDMHVYHYAPYETTAVGTLMGRYGTREDEVDDLLRGNVFVDLYRVVRQGVRVGTESYSIKKLEPLYMPPREGDIGTGGSSIVAYEQWLNSNDQEILDDIEAYNRDDVESTWRLRGWLEGQRQALIDRGVDVPRPAPPREVDTKAIDPTIAELIERLTFDREMAQAEDAEREAVALEEGVDLSPSPGAPLDEARSRWLMADLLQWHRRESKPEWWQYFERLLRYEDDDFVADTETLGGLEFVDTVGTVKRSTIWRYRFDVAQDFKLSAGDKVFDPPVARLNHLTREGPNGSTGTVVALDSREGTIDLSRGNGWDGPHPRSLMGSKPFFSEEQEASLQRVAQALLDHGVDGDGRARAARQLLGRRLPAVRGAAGGDPLRHEGESTLAATARLVAWLEGSYLPVQGPPGAGKTFTAARAILGLVAQGRKVGITAFTHAAIGNVIKAVIKAAAEAGTTVRIGQKYSEDGQYVADDSVTPYNKAQDLVDALGSLDIVAGTAWLFSRPDLVGALDTLVVDEAGQLSLANVLAVAPAAANLVLVGDPQQLAQPSKGTHPDGAGASALEHILDGEATIAEDRGLFLDQTWRMHPLVCEFISEQVYDQRLESRPETSVQTISAGPIVAGSGLRWLPIDHEGNRTSSVEEARALAEVYEALIGRAWIKEDGDEAVIGREDVLVVAPYNAQVHELAVHLPAGARIGTVDKFQGQEAAVVLVSLAASSAEEVSRGMEFLYSRNRLNVAVSRARALCVVAASPRLLAVQCHTVEQMRLANMLCRYVEMAREQDS